MAPVEKESKKKEVSDEPGHIPEVSVMKGSDLYRTVPVPGAKRTANMDAMDTKKIVGLAGPIAKMDLHNDITYDNRKGKTVDISVPIGEMYTDAPGLLFGRSIFFGNEKIPGNIVNGEFIYDPKGTWHLDGISDKRTYGLVNMSKNSGEFFSSLGQKTKSSTDTQKLAVLSALVNGAYGDYDESALRKNTYVVLSDDEMFGALKGHRVSGEICGNISTFALDAAKKGLGFQDAYLQGIVKRARDGNFDGHTLLAVNAKNESSNKEIVFVDKDLVLRTGTLDPREAQGILERSAQYVGPFGGGISKGGKMAAIHSYGSRMLADVAGVRGKLEMDPESGNARSGARMTYDEGPASTQIKVEDGTFAVLLFKYNDDAKNDYMSVKNADAVNAKFRIYKKGGLGVSAGTTVLFTRVKDLSGNEGALYPEIVPLISADYLKDRKLSLGEYGAFKAAFGARLEAAASYIMGNANSYAGIVDANSAASAGVKVAYLTPGRKNTFYVGSVASASGTTNNAQAQKVVPGNFEKEFAVGTEIEVRSVKYGVERKLEERTLERSATTSVSAQGKAGKLSAYSTTTQGNKEYYIPDSGSVGTSYVKPQKWGQIVIYYASEKAEGYRPEYKGGAVLVVDISN